MNLKPMTNNLREKITKYIKSRVDISDIIEGYDIKGLNFNRAIISRFNRTDDNLSGTIFSNTIIGTEGEITNCSRTNFSNCSFKNARILGTLWVRKCSFRNTDLQGCHMPHMKFQFADFRGANFCGGCFPIGSIATKAGAGAKFSNELFDEIALGWELPILTPTQISELLQKPEFKSTVEAMLKENREASKRD